jgi:hypothetical protein
MVFHKQGDVPIQEVRCGCGGIIDKNTKRCKKCGKGLVTPDKTSKGEQEDGEGKNEG